MQVFFYMYEYTYMFLKQEKPEMDDYQRKKTFGYIGKPPPLMQFFDVFPYRQSKFLYSFILTIRYNPSSIFWQS